jgi:hypothetical protein
MAPVFIPLQKLASLLCLILEQNLSTTVSGLNIDSFLLEIFSFPVTYGETTRVKLHVMNEDWLKAETEKEN